MSESEDSERAELIALARAMVARLPVDWVRAESSAGDDSLRATVRELKIIDEITDLHRALHSIKAPSSPTSSESPSKNQSSVRSNSPSETPSTIEIWGPFSLLERVGRGSFGEVYRALDTRLDRQVALKLLHRCNTETAALRRGGPPG